MRTYSRWNVVWSICLGAALASPAYAGWGQAKLISHSSHAALAVDKTGKSHLVFVTQRKGIEQVQYTTFNSTRGKGPNIGVLTLEPDHNLLGPPGIAIDSSNLPHVALVDYISNPASLKYLSFDGSQWNSELIADDANIDIGQSEATSTPMVIDAQDHPHIAYVSTTNGLTYAVFDGSEWQFSAIGGALTPSAMRMAPNGTVYLAGLDQGQICEETGSNGSWSETCFIDSDGINAPGLGLAVDGSPEVVYINENLAEIDLAHFDGTSWTVGSIIKASDLGVAGLSGLAFATDTTGIGKVAFSGEHKHDIAFYAEESAGSWQVTNLGGQAFVSFDAVAMDLDQAGLPRVAFLLGTPIGDFEGYAAETLPALTEQWASIVSATNAGKTTITGTLQVKNFGTAAGAGFTLSYYLSADDQLDPSDVQIGHSALAVGAGQQKVVKFAYTPSGPVSSEYLIAAITAVNPHSEADTSNNLAVGQIP